MKKTIPIAQAFQNLQPEMGWDMLDISELIQDEIEVFRKLSLYWHMVLNQHYSKLQFEHNMGVVSAGLNRLNKLLMIRNIPIMIPIDNISY